MDKLCFLAADCASYLSCDLNLKSLSTTPVASTRNKRKVSHKDEVYSSYHIKTKRNCDIEIAINSGCEVKSYS